MDDFSGCKVIHIDSRRRIALQCVDLLLWNATPSQRRRIADRILAMCDGVHSRRDRKTRRMTPVLLEDLLRIHASCTHPRPRRSLRSAPFCQFSLLGNQLVVRSRERRGQRIQASRPGVRRPTVKDALR
jgi:hypothetical protein